MRVMQFVRRGVIAFAAVAMLSTGFAGVAGAQNIFEGSAGVFPDNDAVVATAIPGYDYLIVHTPGAGEAVLAIGIVPSAAPVAVQFLGDIGGAAVIYPQGDNVIAPRP